MVVKEVSIFMTQTLALRIAFLTALLSVIPFVSNAQLSQSAVPVSGTLSGVCGDIHDINAPTVTLGENGVNTLNDARNILKPQGGGVILVPYRTTP